MWNYEICSEIYHFHTVDDFIDNPTMEGSNILSIPEYVVAVHEGSNAEGTTPVEIVDRIKSLANHALVGTEMIRAGGFRSREAEYLLTDIETMSHLGLYYAHKISAATDLALFRKTKIESYRQSAVGKLTLALGEWKIYGALASGQYTTQRFARTRNTDWKGIEVEVSRDIEIARESR